MARPGSIITILYHIQGDDDDEGEKEMLWNAFEMMMPTSGEIRLHA